MKKRLCSTLAALGVAVGGFIGLTAEPASAHIFDGIAIFACASTNILPTEVHYVHAHPIWFNEFVIQEGCYVTYGRNDQDWCRWEALYWADATVTGPYNMTGDCIQG